MRGRHALFQVGFFVLLFTFPFVLNAQEALTQTYTSADAMFTMSYPEGWTVEEENGLIRFSSDQAFIQVNYRDYGAEVTLSEILEYDILEIMGFSPPENLIIAGYAAIQSAGRDQLQTIFNFCDGMFGLVYGYVPSGQVEAYRPTIMAMMETIRFGDDEPRVCRPAFEGLAPISVTNAAQITQITTLGDETVPVLSVSFNTEQGQLAAGTQNGDVWLWSTVTGEQQRTLTGNRDGATSVAFSSSGFNLAIGTGSGQVRGWNSPPDGGASPMQTHSTAVESVAFHRLLIASGSLDGEVRLWDMISPGTDVVLVDAANPTPVASVAFSPDGTLLAAGGGNTIRLWDMAARTVQTVLETEVGEITSLAFRPDGTALIYGGDHSAVWVWNLAGDNRPLLDGHEGQVSALAFSPDGQIIASSDSAAIRLWDASTGASLTTLQPDADGAVNSVAFSPDGRVLVSGGDSGGVVIWGVSADSAPAQPAAESAGDQETTGTVPAVATCTISAPNQVNLRRGPGTNFDRAGALTAGQTAEVDGQAPGGDGMTWYRLTDGAWVRSDVVRAPDTCAAVPTVTP